MKAAALLHVLVASSSMCGWASESEEFPAVDSDHELRLSVGVPLGSMKGTFQAAGTASLSNRVTWSSANDISLRWIPRLDRTDDGAGMIAVGITRSAYSLAADAGRQSIEQQQVLGVLDLGLGWVPAPAWKIEAAWHLGIGRAWQPGSSSSGGSAFAAGVAIESLVHLRYGLLVGLRFSTEWRSWHAAATLDGVAYDLAFEGLQYVPALVVGWQF